MSDTFNLLPCPFCGEKAMFHSYVNPIPDIDNNGAYIGADIDYYEWVECTGCGVRISLEEDEQDGTTIKKWNKRTGGLS